MFRTQTTVWMFGACALALIGLAVPFASAVEIDWILDSGGGDWDDQNNWEFGLPPSQNDDAKHLGELSHIRVDSNGVCKTLEIDGEQMTDRFMVIESGFSLTVSGSVSKADDTNVLIKLEDGTENDRTILDAVGRYYGVNFLTADTLPPDYVSILTDNDLVDCSFTLGDFAVIEAPEGASETSITVADDALITIGWGRPARLRITTIRSLILA